MGVSVHAFLRIRSRTPRSALLGDAKRPGLSGEKRKGRVYPVMTGVKLGDAIFRKSRIGDLWKVIKNSVTTCHLSPLSNQGFFAGMGRWEVKMSLDSVAIPHCLR